MILTDRQRTELAVITARDASTGSFWFEGPASFTAQAARDRRTLLGLVRQLTTELENYPLLPDADDTPLCPCGAFECDGRVLHAPSCTASTR